MPTFVTGSYSMNVPYSGFSRAGGFAASVGLMVIAGIVLSLAFKRRDWM
jgi:Mg2+ and Co2+ transporter CorA